MSATQTAFERGLDREILLSERLRTSIIGGLIAGIVVVFTIGVLTPPAYAEMQRIFKGQLAWYTPLLFLSPVLAFEAVVWWAIGYLLKTGRKPPIILRYLNALIEITLPTLLLLFAAQVFGPIYSLTTPPVYVYFIFIALAALRLDFALCVFTGVVAGAEYMAVALYGIGQARAAGSFDPILLALAAHLGKAGVMVISGVVTGLVTRQIRQRIANALSEVEERNRIIGLFGQHVSPAVVERLIDQQTVFTTEIRDVCVMFLDIRDFTRFAEKKDPQAVVDYLNALFEFMVESVNRHHGIINKFLGDGFMAVFGAPISSGEDTRNAVACAEEIIQRVAQSAASGVIPATRIGIGLHSGQAVTGNIGALERQEYTIIGDVVNVASRIEQLNKQYEAQLLVSQSVWNEIDSAQWPGAALGAIDVRGHDVPVEVYRLA